MKLFTVVILLSIATGLTSCSTDKVIPPKTAGYVGPEEVTQSSKMPNWYTKPPASSKDYIYFSGTGSSADLGMSNHKAILDAQLKLSDRLNGEMSALANQYKQDIGDTSIDNTDVTVKKLIAATSVVGYNVEDTVVINEGRSYRTFVLVKYPLGEANDIAMLKLGIKVRKEAGMRQAKERMELEKELAKKNERDHAEDLPVQ